MLEERREEYKGHAYIITYDPDEVWPAFWKAVIWAKRGYCHTIHTTSESSAERKAKRYIRRRIRRIERHSNG